MKSLQPQSLQQLLQPLQPLQQTLLPPQLLQQMLLLQLMPQLQLKLKMLLLSLKHFHLVQIHQTWTKVLQKIMSQTKNKRLQNKWEKKPSMKFNGKLINQTTHQ
jgi:hypothetical protein